MMRLSGMIYNGETYYFEKNTLGGAVAGVAVCVVVLIDIFN